MSNKSLAGEHSAQTILVTGGAGFIGSHTCVELLEQNYNVVILDDLSIPALPRSTAFASFPAPTPNS